MQRSTSDLEILPEFSSPEGIYKLLQVLQLEGTTPQDLHSLLGTRISMASIKSSDQQVEVEIEKQVSNKFIEVPLEQNHSASGGDKEKFGFGFKSKKIATKTIQKPNSAFVLKIVANEQLARILSQKSGETFYIFFNVGKALVWADYLWKLQCPLSVIYMKDAFVTCHDVNQVNRDSMSAIIGFNTGDILVYSPIYAKYHRLNRAGAIHKFAVTCITWVPGSESLFIAGFEDGCLMILDKDFEDQNTPISSVQETYLARAAPKGSKNNPRMFWKISKKQLTSIAFSPDLLHFSVTALDGTMNIVNYESGKRTDVYSSFFGGFLCSAWSPDGKYIIAGSQDDLLSIYAFRGRLIARCQGHFSWPRSVMFDPWKCTERHFRFGSVGEDARICLWDFTLAGLKRTKINSIHRGKSINELSKPDGTVFHVTPSKSAIPFIEPIACKQISHTPLYGLEFRDDSIVVSDNTGKVTVFSRPSSTKES